MVFESGFGQGGALAVYQEDGMNEQMEAVQRMQEYIEGHLEEELTLTQLSEVSLYSPWHSYRLFKNYLGATPAEYIRKLRLTRSAMRLKQEQDRKSVV